MEGLPTPLLLNLSNAITKLRQWAEREPLVLALILYGSYARGTANPDSDLDIALVINSEPGDTNPSTTWMFNEERWTADLKMLLDFPKVHLMWLGGNKTPTIEAALEQGRIEVYVRSKGTRPNQFVAGEES